METVDTHTYAVSLFAYSFACAGSVTPSVQSALAQYSLYSNWKDESQNNNNMHEKDTEIPK